MINLRQYQHQIIDDIRNEFRLGNIRVVMQAATGSGKTVCFSYMVKQASERGNRCLILTDRIELLEQAGGTFDRVGIQYENITAETKLIPSGRVLVAMVETIKRRAKARLDFQMLLKSVNLVICDESHKVSFDEIFQYLSPDCYVIGCTATPTRQSKKNPLLKHYTSLVTGPSIGNLIKDGYLSRPEYFGVSVDLSKVKMKNGDFDEKDQQKVFTETKVFEGLKHNLLKHAYGMKTMIFCPNVESSIQVSRDLNCLHIDGNMSITERTRILNIFENTPGAILSNCAITTTGYDCPDIECIVLYRATTSLPLYLQMIGRGSRTTKLKNRFHILDFGTNIQRFGYWHIDRQWSLDNPVKKNKNKQDVFPVKFCPECGSVLSVNVKLCSYCGFTWPVTEKERVFAELEKLTYSEVQRKISEAKTVKEMEEIRQAKGYKVGYLLHRFKTEQQFIDYEKLKGYRPGWSKIQVKNYLHI
jgi:superfamily II DNA or RNA helicase